MPAKVRRVKKLEEVEDVDVEEVEKVGEVEIVFTGLCAFLNLSNTNGTMPDPSVMMPRTSPEYKHVPFIAFDKREVTVSTDDGAPFQYVNTTNQDFYYRILDGHYITLLDDPVGWPNVLPSYDLVVRKDDYWPDAKNKWDRRFVPIGDMSHDPRFVGAHMYLGAGTVSAERMTDFPWEFRDEQGNPSLRGYFAQEMVYRIYPFRYTTEFTIQIVLEPIEGGLSETYSFKSARPNVDKIKLWIGNNDADDIHRALLRLSSQPKKADHFEFLNDVSSVSGIGPVPSPLVPKGTFPAPISGGGTGSDTGYCGPFNPNGG